MSVLRTVGGILSLFVGILSLLMPLAVLFDLPLLNAMTLKIVCGPIPTYINLIIACFAIVGGILGLKTVRKAGGVFALVAGAMWTLGGVLHVYFNTFVMAPYSFLGLWTGIYWWIFTIEATLVLLGSIFILADNSE